MEKKIINVAIITNIIPSYREGFYDRLFKRDDMNVKVYCQKKIPGLNLISIHNKYGGRIRLIKYLSGAKEMIVWQFLPWLEIFSAYDVIFIGGNPRVISDVAISTILHLSGKSVVHWIMAHSFRANTITENVRLFWSRIFKYIFVYTDEEVSFLRRKGFKRNYISGMNNGLDQKEIDAAILRWPAARLKAWRISNGFENNVLVLSCARLEAKNNFELVIRALPLMLDRVPNLVWCLIGGGREKEKLATMAKRAGLEEKIRFLGEKYDEDELAPWFLSSEVLIHPAAVGLTMLHSFGYGLPVVTHGEAKHHNPEYAAFEPERTGRIFHRGDFRSLAETVVGLLGDGAARVNMKQYASRVAREKYNVDIMVERFVGIANKAIKAGCENI
jgi:glycosyltransferase involved in cell wall biosynthesis